MSGNRRQDIWCYFARIYRDQKRGNLIAFETEWVGFADNDSRIELRQPRLLEYTSLRDYHSKHDPVPMQFVSTTLELCEFLIKGGAAAIEESIAKAQIPRHLTPKPAVTTGFGPFDPLDTTIEAATQRAPSKKMRMTILKRDGFRCVVCGQRPADDPNIVLNVHHIRPWKEHGATTSSNLVTLCHTCHLGLDPHYNAGLANLIDDPEKRWEALQTPPKFDT